MVYRDGVVTPFDMGPLGGDQHALATADDPLHDAHRKLLVPHLAAKRIRVIEEFAEATAIQLWTQGGVIDGRIEWMSAMANRLPMMVVADLLGLPPQEDVDKLIRLGYATTTLLDGVVSQSELDAAGAAAMELAGYVMEHFAKAGGENPAPGLIGDLAARYASGEVEHMPAMAIMLTLFSAAGESTASLLGSAAWILATHNDIQEQLRAQPERLGGVHRGDAAVRVTVSRALSPRRPGHHSGRCRAASRLTTVVDVGGRQPRPPPTVRESQRVPPGPHRRERAHRVRQGRALLRRGPHWPAWKPRSCCGRCWIRPPGSKPRRLVSGYPASWSADLIV